MKTMASELIASLQRCVKKYGDLPVALRDSDNAVVYYDFGVYHITPEAGEDEIEQIGLSF